jgi:hypothetical protein
LRITNINSQQLDKTTRPVLHYFYLKAFQSQRLDINTQLTTNNSTTSVTMRSFQNVIVLLFALIAFAFAAQEPESYDATVYVTSTIFRVNTVTMSGPSSSGAVANQTSTIRAPTSGVPTSIAPTYVAPTATYGTNSTSVKPTGSATKSASPEFTGAASSLNANALVVALVAGVGYLVL